MTACDKITQYILLDAETEAKSIVDNAVAKAEEIKAEGKLKADELLKELKDVADKKQQAANESALSTAKLSVRNAVLLKKREEIDKTLIALEQHFISLPQKEYFDVLLVLAKRYATKEQGVMVVNSNDLERMSDDFKKNLEKLNITVSAEANNSIGGGFILKYNDIEQNADFKALIAEKKEQLTDIINKQLF